MTTIEFRSVARDLDRNNATCEAYVGAGVDADGAYVATVRARKAVREAVIAAELTFVSVLARAR